VTKTASVMANPSFRKWYSIPYSTKSRSGLNPTTLAKLAR
jgi:hypothetical protein